VSSSAPPLQHERRRGAPRGRPAGRLVVGDHVGHAAADAAQAVRRAGLRPGLDRSFGCEAEEIGTVVAQDPPAGSELARNAMVTLYVAAPGAAPTHEPETPQPDAQQTISSIAAPPTDTAPSAPDAHRPRKARLAAGPRTHALDPAPQPVMPPGDEAATEVSAGPTPMVGTARTDSERPSSWEADNGAFADHGQHTELHERHFEDLFSGGDGEKPGWRRVYPRQPVAATLRRARRWAGSHRFLALSACAVLTLAVGEAAIGKLASRHAPTAPASDISTPDPATPNPRVGAALPHTAATRATRIGMHKRPSEKPQAHARRSRHASAHRPHGGPAAVHRAGATPPAPGNSASAPAPEHTTGGPFSP
jgi:hypothetical protein